MFSDSSYQSFFIQDQLTITEGKGGFPFIRVDNEYANALISIYGAQVLSYKPKLENADKANTQDKDLLFVSDLAYYEAGKAIKGGIPICWPWFGRDSDNPDRQMHGFVRNMLWQLDNTSSTDIGETQIVLSLTDSDETHKLWPYDFKVILMIVVGKTLRLTLQTVNAGYTEFKITQALHAYFSIADIDQVQIDGLDNVEYIDTVGGVFKTELQRDKVIVNQEVDRIYTDVPSNTVLIDQKLKREITIDSVASKTTVVWNPWKELSEKSCDLADDAYKHFICIETANTVEDFVVVEPNESFTIGAEYTVT